MKHVLESSMKHVICVFRIIQHCGQQQSTYSSRSKESMVLRFIRTMCFVDEKCIANCDRNRTSEESKSVVHSSAK